MQDEKPPMKKLPTSMLPEETAPRPEFPEQEQTPPGLDAEMEPSPDHGETSYTGSGRLAGKKALITGGDSGIGRAVAIAFAREGADVAINYLPEEQKDADEVIALIKAEGRTAVALPGDIRSESFCQSLVADAVEQLGGLSIRLITPDVSNTAKPLRNSPPKISTPPSKPTSTRRSGSPAPHCLTSRPEARLSIPPRCRRINPARSCSIMRRPKPVSRSSLNRWLNRWRNEAFA